MCHLAWTLKSKSQQSNAHILSTKSWKMFVLIQLDLEGNSCLDKVLKMGKISNTSWNKKMNTGISHISKCRYVCKYYCIDVVKCRTLIFHGIEWIIPLRKVQREDISVEDISVEDILEISSAELSSTELSSIEMSSAEMSSAVIR